MGVVSIRRIIMIPCETFLRFLLNSIRNISLILSCMGRDYGLGGVLLMLRWSLCPFPGPNHFPGRLGWTGIWRLRHNFFPWCPGGMSWSPWLRSTSCCPTWCYFPCLNTWCLLPRLKRHSTISHGIPDFGGPILLSLCSVTCTTNILYHFLSCVPPTLLDLPASRVEDPWCMLVLPI